MTLRSDPAECVAEPVDVAKPVDVLDPLRPLIQRKASELFENDKHDEFREWLDESVPGWREMPTGRFYAGLACLKTELWSMAEDHLVSAKRLWGDYPDACRQLAKARLDRVEDALALLQASRRHPLD